MLYVKTVLVILELLLLCTFAGCLASKILKKEYGIFACINEGFVWVLGIFALLALPFLWFGWSFHILFYIFLLLALLIMLCGGYIFFKEKVCKLEYFSGTKDVLMLLTLLLIVVQMVCSTYLYHEDDDDGYYIAISNLAVEQDIVQTDSKIVYNGVYKEEIGTGFQPPVVSWELFLACLAKFNHVHAAILAHSILPLLLIAVSYLAIWRLGLVLFDGNNQKKNSIRFLFFYAALNLFGGFLGKQPACFLLLRIWQGKAVLVNVVFPLLIENCLQIYKGNEKGCWARGTVLLMAGMMISSVGLTIAPLCYVSYGMPYLFSLFCNERERFRQCLWKAVLSMVPSVCFCIISYLYVMSHESGYVYSYREPGSWLSCLQNTMGTVGNGYLLLSVLALVVIFKFGGTVEKLCLLGGTGIAFLTFLNPLFSGIVGQKIVGVDVYWRVWWAVPVYAMIAASFIYLMDLSANMAFRAAVFFLAISGIAWSGRYMYQENLYFKGYQNAYKLPGEVVAVCDYILERDEYASILAPAEISAKIRQYSTKLYVPKARGMPGSRTIVPDMELTYGQVYGAVFDDKYISTEIYNALKKMDIKYIVTKEEITGSHFVGKCEEMYVWEI